MKKLKIKAVFMLSQKGYLALFPSEEVRNLWKYSVRERKTIQIKEIKPPEKAKLFSNKKVLDITIPITVNDLQVLCI